MIWFSIKWHEKGWYAVTTNQQATKSLSKYIEQKMFQLSVEI